MRYFITILVTSLWLFSSNLEITSNNFYYKDGEQKAKFNGNVVAKEGDSIIKSDSLIVFLDKNSEAKKYKASGSVTFEIKNEKRDIKGKCNTLVYMPVEDKYILIGSVVLEDILNKRKVYGDEIVLDNKNSSSYAKSQSRKPVKFIFKVKSKK